MENSLAQNGRPAERTPRTLRVQKLARFRGRQTTANLLAQAVAILFVLSNRLQSFAQTVNSGEERSLEYIAPWPPWVSILLVALCGVVIYGLYAREPDGIPIWKRACLGTARLALIGIILWMMYGFTERPFRTDLPDLLLVVDDSPSMETIDSFDNEDFVQKLETDLASVELTSATRLNQAKSLLLKDNARLLEFLTKNYQVKLSGLDISAAATGSQEILQHVNEMAAKGEKSLLGQTLRQGLQQNRGRPIAAVLLITDGVTTDGPLLSEVAKEAEQRNVPLHIVGLGSQSPAKDLKLSDLLVNDIVFVGDMVTFDITLSANGYANQAADITLRRADGLGEPATQRVDLTSDHHTQPIRLTYEAVQQGTFDFVVEVSAKDNEATTDNNQLPVRIEVRDEKTRVLLVQSYPNFEYHYLKTLLQRESRGDEISRNENEAGGSVELSVLLQDADAQFADIDEASLRSFPSREELFTYDVCIFGDVNPSYLGNSALQDLRDFVLERGRGFIGIAGPRFFPSEYSDTPLADVIPFEIRNVLAPPADLPIEVGYKAQLTDLGQSMSALQLAADSVANAERWRNLHELYWLLEVDTLKMGTRTLLEHPSRRGTSDQPYPIVTLSYAGAGKVLFHYTDDSWRWRIGRGDEVYARYWRQTIRYLTRFKLGAGRDIELTSDRDTYKRGEIVRLRTRFFDERLAPDDDQGVTVMLEQEGARRQQVKLSREPARRGIFTGDINELRTGSYHAWISEPAFETDSPSIDFLVTAPDTELTRLQIDVNEMKLAAKTSGGKFFDYQSASALVDEIPTGRHVRIESLTPEPIWNSWPVALLFVALLVTEWISRRQLGMV